MNTAPDSAMTLEDVIDYLRANQRTLYRLAMDRRMPGFEMGTTWRLKRAGIDRWVDAQAAAGMPEPAVSTGQLAGYRSL